MGGKRNGGPGPARWNDETQSWEDGGPPRARHTGPPPPRPAYEPAPGAPGQEPSADPARATDTGYGPPGGGRRPGSTALIAVVALAVVAAGFGGGWLVWGPKDDKGRDAAGERPPAASAPATPPSSPPPATDRLTPAGTPTASPSASGGAVPQGFHQVRDEEGFSLAVPDGWRRSQEKTGVFYRSPDGRGLLQIFEITEADFSPREALKEASKGLSGNPGYQEISLEQVADQGPSPDAAQLVYEYDSEKLGVRCRGVDRAFTGPDGHHYAVLAMAPAADWPRQEEVQKAALASFVPDP